MLDFLKKSKAQKSLCSAATAISTVDYEENKYLFYIFAIAYYPYLFVGYKTSSA